MIAKEILNFNYYYNKLPIYLQQSPTFPEHFHIWWEFLTNVDDSADKICELINIFDSNYLTNYGDICDEFLDYIGNLYGVKRNLSVDIEGTTYQLQLTQDEFLLLIKCQIIKNYCDGSRSQIDNFYKDAGLTVLMLCQSPAIINLYLQSTNTTDNINKLFLAGLLTIENLGIAQIRMLSQDVFSYLVWDSPTQGTWDVNIWG